MDYLRDSARNQVRSKEKKDETGLRRWNETTRPCGRPDRLSQASLRINESLDLRPRCLDDPSPSTTESPWSPGMECSGGGSHESGAGPGLIHTLGGPPTTATACP